MMNMKNSIFIFCLFILIASCKEDELPDTDNIQEFAFLIDTEFSANESGNSTPENAIEINAEMLTFDPRPVDVVLSLELIENGAVAGVDYEVVSASNTITIPAGSRMSTEGFKVRTIDNNLQALEDRILTVRLVSVDDTELNLGLGLEDVTNLEATITIADDECPDTIDKFDGATWAFSGSNTVYYSDYSGTYVTEINGDKMTISGDLANYDVGITVDATLVPDGLGATTGTITFDPSSQGSDGSYDYRWILKQPGTYDICAETMELTVTIQYIDIFGPDPTAWVDWYDSSISATIESLGDGSTSCFLDSFDSRTASVSSSFTDFNSEYFYDDYDGTFSDLQISVNEDCSTLTVSGDFLDLGASLSDIEITFNITPDDNDSNIGTLTLTTQVIGDDGGGFEYRVRSTGVNGTFNIANGTIDVELFVDYNNSGAGYINWYTATSAFTLN